MELWRPFAETFDAENLTLFRTEHWSVLVRKGQATLGTLVLAANRNFISASEFTQDELLELPQVVGRLEGALAEAFAYDKINYLTLMMSDRHYHSHVVPRYEGVRAFGGLTWEDPDWPGPPSVGVPPADGETLAAIRDHLKQFV
jgi:diadenosine tetraphosphate (Ap4A) HIT family hydrolase